MRKLRQIFAWTLPVLLLLTGLQMAAHVELPALPCSDCAPSVASPRHGPCDNPEHHHHAVHEYCAVCAVHAAKGIGRQAATMAVAPQVERLAEYVQFQLQVPTLALPVGRGPPQSLVTA